jgi:hypothetical protein
MRIRVLVMGALALLPAVAHAQVAPLGLTDEERAALPQQAQSAYDQAIQAMNHSDFPDALAQARHAAELAPESVTLQFLTADLAQDVLATAQGTQALSATDAAAHAYQQVVDSESAKPWQIERARVGLEELSRLTAETASSELQMRRGNNDFLVEYSASQATRLPTREEARARESASSTSSGSGAAHRVSEQSSTAGTHPAGRL